MSLPAQAERPAPTAIEGIRFQKSDGASSLSNAFWFGQLDLRALALFRIGFGLYIIWDLIDLLPHASVWFSDAGVFPRSVMLGEARVIRFSLMDAFASTPFLIYLYLAISMATFACVALGYRTRLAQVFGYILLAGLDERVNELYDGADSVIRILLFWLCFVPSGNRYSLDSLFAEEKGAPLPPTSLALPIRLIQLQIGWIYLSSCLNKLIGKMWTALPIPDAKHDFVSPALHYALHLSHAFAKPWAVLVADDPWAMAFGSWFTIVLEGSFLALTFAPVFNKPLKALALAAATALHLGILASMNVGLFSLLMPITYVVFFEPEWIEWILSRFAPLCRKPAVTLVIYDGNCAVCSRTQERLARMDRFSNLRFADFRKEELPKALAGALKPKVLEKRIHVLRPDGRVESGWDGMSSIFSRLPSLVVVAPLMRLPILSSLGASIHGWVVDRRHVQAEVQGDVPGRAPPRVEPFFPETLKRRAGVALLLAQVGLFVCTTWYSGPPWMTQNYPDFIEPIVQTFSVWTSWDMFSPDPLSEDYHLTAPAEFSDGSKGDLFEEPVSLAVSVRKNFFSRWYKYMENVIGGGETLPRQWAEWQCRYHNANNPPLKLYSFKLRKLTQLIPPIGQPYPPVDSDDIWIAQCYDKPGADKAAPAPTPAADKPAEDAPAAPEGEAAPEPETP